jgi:hypothetical protein
LREGGVLGLIGGGLRKRLSKRGRGQILKEKWKKGKSFKENLKKGGFLRKF